MAAAWDHMDVEYQSEAFMAGIEDGKAGNPAAPGDRTGKDYASYMEGWLMGDCEKRPPE